MAPRKQGEESVPGRPSSLAAYSYVENFAFGQLFIFLFSQTVHCEMRDWKNTAEKYHRMSRKVKSNNGKAVCS